MASTIRAYGLRGAAIATGTTAIAAATQGVLTAITTVLALEIFFAVVACVALAMAGATAARRSRAGALGLALGMALLFFWLRWSCWHAMTFGGSAAAAFALSPPWDWPGAMAALVADGALSGHFLWVTEWTAVIAAAATGALMGHEPRD